MLYLYFPLPTLFETETIAFFKKKNYIKIQHDFHKVLFYESAI